MSNESVKRHLANMKTALEIDNPFSILDHMRSIEKETRDSVSPKQAEQMTRVIDGMTQALNRLNNDDDYTHEHIRPWAQQAVGQFFNMFRDGAAAGHYPK